MVFCSDSNCTQNVIHCITRDTGLPKLPNYTKKSTVSGCVVLWVN